jgi:hypothetical protein
MILELQYLNLVYLRLVLVISITNKCLNWAAQYGYTEPNLNWLVPLHLKSAFNNAAWCSGVTPK